MSRESTCRCLICGLERSLTQQLSEADRQERYRQFAVSRSLQPAFPAVSDLTAYLRTCRSAANGAHPADRILAELLQTNAIKANTPTLRDLPLLAFIPTVHSTSRQVATRYPSLSADDIAQHVVVSLLQILGSPEFCNRNSHVAYAISRLLKRNTFEWADRECRLLVYRARRENLFNEPAGVDSAEPVERSALLRYFLHCCHQRGLLTGEDMALLVQFKLDAARDSKTGCPEAEYSNASRQRMKRLMCKLRLIARTPRRPHRAGGMALAPRLVPRSFRKRKLFLFRYDTFRLAKHRLDTYGESSRGTLPRLR
jgi:hypothetical protein